jgi:hypothetical protein
MSIMNDPEHPRWGEVRRIWLILAQMNLHNDSDAVVFERTIGNPWEKVYLQYREYYAYSEARATREIVRDWLYVIGNFGFGWKETVR